MTLNIVLAEVHTDEVDVNSPVNLGLLELNSPNASLLLKSPE